MSPLRVISASRRALLAAVSAAALTTVLTAQPQVQFTDERFPIDGIDPDGWLVSRVVDDLAGTPIVGAEILMLTERETPLAGELWFERKVVTDADGFLRLPCDPAQGGLLLAIRHPAVGVSTRFGVDAIWRVGRPFDVPVRVLDWLGRPAAGAQIGFCGGCGHTPDLVNAIAGEDGVAVLRGIDPHNGIADVYVQWPGLELGYQSIDWFPGDGPWELRCGWAPAKTGRLLDHRGQPVAGAFVGALDVHRGPWAVTDANGAFAVLGAPPDTDTCDVRLADGRKFFFPSPASYPATLHLPVPDGDDPQEGAVDAVPEPPPPELHPVRFVVAGGPERVEVVVRYPGGKSEVVLAAEDRGIGELQLPVGPCVFELTDAAEEFGQEQRFAIDDLAVAAAPLVLQWTPEHLVVGTVVDEQGQAVPCDVELKRPRYEGGSGQRSDDGAFRLSARDPGHHLLTLKPRNAGLLERQVRLWLPSRWRQPQLDVGALVVRAGPWLQVVLADGKPMQGGSVTWLRAGCQEAGQGRVLRRTGADGWFGPDLAGGDALVIRLDDTAVPFRITLADEGPWRVVAPDARIDLQVVDEAGEPVRGCVTLDDFAAELPLSAPLHGLAPGPVRLRIGAAGHRSAIVDAIAGPAGAPVRIVLPRR